MSWNIELDSAKFISAPRLVWEATLKKTKVKLDFLNDIDVLLVIEKGIRRGIYNSIYQYAKYIKDYDKNKELSYLQYLDVNNLYGWAMSQKFPT